MQLTPISYTIPPSPEFRHYDRYFHDAVIDFIGGRYKESPLFIIHRAYLNPPRVVLQAEDENPLWFAARAINSEIRTTPFTFGLIVPLAELHEARQIQSAAAKLETLRRGHDFRTAPDDVEEDFTTLHFHRASHRQIFADALSCDAFSHRCAQFDCVQEAEVPVISTLPQRPVRSDSVAIVTGGTVVTLDAFTRRPGPTA